MAARQRVKVTRTKRTTVTRTTRGLGALAGSPKSGSKRRKTRSDKGKKRGPYKKRSRNA